MAGAQRASACPSDLSPKEGAALRAEWRGRCREGSSSTVISLTWHGGPVWLGSGDARAHEESAPRKMNAAPQEALISVFLQFIEERGCWAYGALSQASHPRPRPPLLSDMNLLHRKSRLEWKPSKDPEEPRKG